MSGLATPVTISFDHKEKAIVLHLLAHVPQYCLVQKALHSDASQEPPLVVVLTIKWCIHHVCSSLIVIVADFPVLLTIGIAIDVHIA